MLIPGKRLITNIIFSKNLINNAITWAKAFQSEPNGYVGYSEH